MQEVSDGEEVAGLIGTIVPVIEIWLVNRYISTGYEPSTRERFPLPTNYSGTNVPIGLETFFSTTRDVLLYVRITHPPMMTVPRARPTTSEHIDGHRVDSIERTSDLMGPIYPWEIEPLKPTLTQQLGSLLGPTISHPYWRATSGDVRAGLGISPRSSRSCSNLRQFAMILPILSLYRCAPNLVRMVIRFGSVDA